MLSQRSLILQTGLNWQRRIKFSLMSILPSGSFMHPLDELISSLSMSSTLYCVLPPAPQVLVPAHIQVSPSRLHWAHPGHLLHRLHFRLLGSICYFRNRFQAELRISSEKPLRNIPIGGDTVDLCNCTPSLRWRPSVKLSFAGLCDLSLSEKHFNMQEVNHSKCCVWENYMFHSKIDLRCFLACVLHYL